MSQFFCLVPFSNVPATVRNKDGFQNSENFPTNRLVSCSGSTFFSGQGRGQGGVQPQGQRWDQINLTRRSRNKTSSRFDSRPSPNSGPVGQQLKERPSPPLTVFNLPTSNQVKILTCSLKATSLSHFFAAVDARAPRRSAFIPQTSVWRFQVNRRYSTESSDCDLPSSPHLTNSQSVIPNPPPSKPLSPSQPATPTPRPIKRSGHVLPGEEDLFAEELISSGSRRNTRKSGSGKKKNNKKNQGKKNKKNNNVSSRRSESGEEKKEKKSSKQQKKKELEAKEEEEEAARSSREQMQVGSQQQQQQQLFCKIFHMSLNYRQL